MKNLLGNILLLAFSFAIVFVMGEVASRYILPMSPGPSILDMQGKKQKISYIAAGQQFRIITPDYDAVTTITQDGYRAPQVQGNPETIFIGDSFTYGQGVKDDEAFPALYCREKAIQCANLAVPGSSTQFEIDRLEQFLKSKQWMPKQVMLFFFTGNDFSDNTDADEKIRQGLPYEPVEMNPLKVQQQKSLKQRMVETGLHYSNLLRVAYYKVLPLLRDNPEASEASLDHALKITQQEFARLQKLSEQYTFDYKIFVIFPQHEITQNIYPQLTQKIQAISTTPIIPLGDLFKQNTSQYFFPTDGHFTIEGNKKLAEFLLSSKN